MLPQKEQIFWPIVYEEKTFKDFYLYRTMEKFTPAPIVVLIPHQGSWFEKWIYTTWGWCFHTSHSFCGLMICERNNFKKYQQQIITNVQQFFVISPLMVILAFYQNKLENPFSESFGWNWSSGSKGWPEKSCQCNRKSIGQPRVDKH